MPKYAAPIKERGKVTNAMIVRIFMTSFCFVEGASHWCCATQERFSLLPSKVACDLEIFAEMALR